MTEHPKSKSMGGFYCPELSPVTISDSDPHHLTKTFGIVPPPYITFELELEFVPPSPPELTLFPPFMREEEFLR